MSLIYNGSYKMLELFFIPFTVTFYISRFIGFFLNVYEQRNSNILVKNKFFFILIGHSRRFFIEIMFAIYEMCFVI